MKRLWAAYAQLMRWEGSTRSSSLMRILLALLVWARWARDMELFRELEPWRLAFSTTFFLSTVLMAMGLFSRISTLVAGLHTCALVWYFGHRLGHEPYTHHHTTALALGTLLTAFTPCGGSYSLDRWLQVRRAERAGAAPPPERGALWGLPLVGLLVASIYLWGGVAKCDWAFLSGDRMEHHVMTLYLGSNYPTWPGFRQLMQAGAWGSTLFEFALAIGLFFRRGRKWLIPLGLAFHAFIYWTMPVGTFTLTMCALYLAFPHPDRVHDVLDRLQGHPPRPA